MGEIENIDSATMFVGKGSKKDLVLELCEGEDILDCIKQGMIMNNVHKVKVVGIEGIVKEATVNYMMGSNFKHRDLRNAKPTMAGGHYELMGRDRNELYGNLKIVLREGNRIETYTVAEGIASEGLKIRLQFINVEEQNIIE